MGIRNINIQNKKGPETGPIRLLYKLSFESILEGFRRPNVFFDLGPNSFIQGFREIPTILLMRWAFSRGLMQFGVFKTRG